MCAEPGSSPDNVAERWTNGTPACSPSPLCRRGCLVGDVDDNAEINMRDVAGRQFWLGVGAEEDDYSECTRVFDFNEDGVIDLEDFETLEVLLRNGV